MPYPSTATNAPAYLRHQPEEYKENKSLFHETRVYLRAFQSRFFSQANMKFVQI